MVESLEAEGSKTATRWFQCQMCGHEYSTRNQWKIECPNCGSIEVRQATKTQPDPIQAKVQEVARGILATNKGMDPAEAHKLATKTVKRFPQMVKAAGPEKSGNFGDPGWYIAERDGTAIVGPYATEQDALDALRPLRTLGDPGEFHHVIHREGAKTADYSPEEAGVKVGDIFYTSWGYDQTNVEFYEVTGLTGASVKIRQIASEDVSSDSDMHMRLVPKPGVYVDALPLRGQEVTKRLVGSPGSPSLKIDDSRRAWLWDGKPKYQTGYGYGH